MIRKASLSLILLLVLSNFLLAQSNKKGDLYLGISAGPIVSNLRSSLDRSEEIKQMIGPVGYHADLLEDLRYGIATGLQLEYFLVDHLSLKTAIRYENKGMDMSTVGTVSWNSIDYETGSPYSTVKGNKINRLVRNNYLTAPILIRKYCFKKKNFFVEGGSYVSYLLKSEIDIHDTQMIVSSFPPSSDSDEFIVEEPITTYVQSMKLDGIDGKEHTNTWDYGLSLGAGYGKNFGDRLRLEAELLMNYGLRKVDAQFNNQVQFYPATTGFSSSFGTSTVTGMIPAPGMNAVIEDYYGLNSNAKNISLSLNIGISYRLGK